MTTDKRSAHPLHRVGLLGGAAALVGTPTAVLLLATAGPAAGVTTLTVDTIDDGAATAADCTTPVAGSCSLRDALAAVSNGDTIQFAPGLTGTIALNADIVISTGVTIAGPGADVLTVAQTAHFRIFDIDTSATDVSISGLTLADGNTADRGGAIRALNTGSLTLRDVAVSGNTSDGGGGGVFALNGGALTIAASTIDGNESLTGWGGGLYVGSTGRAVTIVDSTVSNNVAPNAAVGGGILFGGSDNTVLIANTTITGNSAEEGGGIGAYDDSTFTIVMSTITGNAATKAGSSADYGGGVAFQQNYTSRGAAQSASIIGTILSGNSSTASPGQADLGNFRPEMTITVSDSLIGAVTTNGFIDGGGNIVSSTPGLGALADNGGPTMTMALLTGSPALDAGPTTVPTFPGDEWDQRSTGYARVSNGRVDMGAFEVQVAPVPPEPVAPSFTG